MTSFGIGMVADRGAMVGVDSQIGALDGSGESFVAFSFAAIARYRLFSYPIGVVINPFEVGLAW